MDLNTHLFLLSFYCYSFLHRRHQSIHDVSPINGEQRIIKKAKYLSAQHDILKLLPLHDLMNPTQKL